MIKEVKCPNCGYINTVMISEYNGKKVVFDTCLSCGTKLTDFKE